MLGILCGVCICMYLGVCISGRYGAVGYRWLGLEGFACYSELLIQV